MAVCLESSSGYKINSHNGQKRDKSLFLVKLTDSCLKSIEQLQNPSVKSKLSKNGSTRKPLIQFKCSGKSGTLFIPSTSGADGDGRKFNFSCASIFMANSTIGLDCLQQNKGDTDLSLLGTITEKITVSANNDSYEATRTRMAEAEKERKGNSAKVIELSKNGSVKKTKRISNPRQNINFRKLNVNNKISQTSSSSHKGLREKVIHFLAQRPCNKLELRMKLEKDGVKLKDAVSLLTNILQQVSVMQDNMYVLNRHLYTEIQVDTWPGYTDEDRQTIRNKLVSEMGSSVDRLSPGPLIVSSLLGNNSAKRPLPSSNKPGTNPAGKRPRIAHSNNSTPKNDVKRPSPEKSPPKLTSQPPRNIPSRRASREMNKTKHDLNKKTPSKDTPKTRNGSENNSNDNNNNCSFSETESSTNEDYLLKYPEIKTYEQRCSFKEDFAKEYAEFTETKERLDLVTKQFSELKERLKQYPEDSQAAKELEEEIFKVYEEKKDRWAKDRQRLNYLYPKLSHIKKLVIQYDQVYFAAS